MSAEHSPISPLDVAWLFVESDHTPMHVGCLQVFEPPPDTRPGALARLHDELLGHQSCIPPFSLRMHPNGLSLPDWESLKSVDIEYHVQHWALPAPGDEAELNALVARLHGEALDLSRPLWEFHLIEGLADGNWALYVKMHHSIMDGVNGMRVLQSMLSTDPRERRPPPWSPDSPVAGLHMLSAPKHQGRLARTLQQLRPIVEQVRNLPQVTGSLGSLAWAGLHRRHSDLQAPYTAPVTKLNQRVSRHRNFAHARLDLSRMRTIAAHAGVSINDVLLAICAGGLRRYLQDHQALPEDSLIGGLPLSLRAENDNHAGTAVSFILASLGTHLGDARERLGHIHESTRAAKQHMASLKPSARVEYTLLLMAPFMAELLTGLAGRLRPAFNLIISNVPGPNQPLYFNGARLQAMYPLSIVTHGQALNITALGYQDQLQLGLTCCQRQAPGVAGLACELEREMLELWQWGGK